MLRALYERGVVPDPLVGTCSRRPRAYLRRPGDSQYGAFPLDVPGVGW